MKNEDRVAIVTGAAGNGMGRSIALTLAREGAKVVVNYRSSRESAAAIVDHINSQDGEAVAFQADIFTQAGCQGLVSATLDRFGRVDICVIGPGCGWHPEPPDRLVPDAALDDVQQEVAPFYYLAPLVLPGMYERKWGRLVGLSLHPTRLPPAFSYNAAKAARTQVMLLAQNQAWVGGVTINIVAPGPIDSIANLAEAVEQCDHGPAWQNRVNVSPQDIAEGVAFLCSEAGRYVTGCMMPYMFH